MFPAGVTIAQLGIEHLSLFGSTARGEPIETRHRRCGIPRADNRQVRVWRGPHRLN
jgi:hypothetical protein